MDQHLKKGRRMGEGGGGEGGIEGGGGGEGEGKRDAVQTQGALRSSDDLQELS